MEDALPTLDSYNAGELESHLKRLERQNWAFWLLTAAILLGLTACTAILYVYALGTPNQLWQPASYSTLIASLGGLVALFVLYMVFKQQQLARLRVEVITQRLSANLMEASLREMTILFEATVDMAAAADGAQTTNIALRQLREAFRADFVGLYPVAAIGGVLRPDACDPPLTRSNPGPVLDGSVERVVLAAGERDSRSMLIRSSVKSVNAGTVMVAPLHPPGVPSGVPDSCIVVARDPRETPFEEFERRLLGAFVAHLAAVRQPERAPVKAPVPLIRPVRRVRTATA